MQISMRSIDLFLLFIDLIRSLNFEKPELREEKHETKHRSKQKFEIMIRALVRIKLRALVQTMLRTLIRTLFSPTLQHPDQKSRECNAASIAICKIFFRDKNTVTG